MLLSMSNTASNKHSGKQKGAVRSYESRMKRLEYTPDSDLFICNYELEGM